ncbi:MAG: hypothetical protein J6P94_06110 [Oscillospiraceae bacterium]|nr:hypothetical protein [Oscillospiraceae bacterium]
MIIELARNGYIVTEQDGDKAIYRTMDELMKEQFVLVMDSLKACGKIEVELNIIEIDAEETDELVEE